MVPGSRAQYYGGTVAKVRYLVVHCPVKATTVGYNLQQLNK
jgi:hypothetical protein